MDAVLLAPRLLKASGRLIDDSMSFRVRGLIGLANNGLETNQ